MSNYTESPSNWRDVAAVTHRDNTDCVDLNGYNDGQHAYECSEFDCDVCKMSNDNPDRAQFIQSCKDRLAEEQIMKKKDVKVFYIDDFECPRCKIHLLNNSIEQIAKHMNECEGTVKEKKPYPLDKVGPVLSLTPVIVEVNNHGCDGKWKQKTLAAIYKTSIYSETPRFVFCTVEESGMYAWDHCRHIPPVPVKNVRPMTAQEIVMLPRGTAFVTEFNCTIYCPRILQEETGEIRIGEYGIEDVKGYRLPGTTEILPLTVEETV